MLWTLGGAEGLEAGFGFGCGIREGLAFRPVHFSLLHLVYQGIFVVFFHVKIF